MSAPDDVFGAIADGATHESPLWGELLRAREAWEREPCFSTLAASGFATAIETIYEGYLLHYGRSRMFEPSDPDTAVLLGDYLYAHGLVRLAAMGNVVAVQDMAELISLCARQRAERLPGDGSIWAATAAALGTGDPRLDAARAALRLDVRAVDADRLARELVSGEALDGLLAAHVGRTG